MVAGIQLEMPTVGWNVSMLQIDIQILLTSVVTNDRNRSSVRMEPHRPRVSQLTADNAVVIYKSFVNYTEPFENSVVIDRPKLACSTTSSSDDAMTNSNVVHNSKPGNMYSPHKRGHASFRISATSIIVMGYGYLCTNTV